jgi:hypothetical protein
LRALLTMLEAEQPTLPAIDYDAGARAILR